MMTLREILPAGVLILSALFAVQVSAAETPPADLLAQAKISQDQAQRTALAKVPHGEVKSAELEKENGRLVWSFDVTQPSVKTITEVQVDAKTGKIASIKKESAADEAKEAKADKHAAK